MKPIQHIAEQHLAKWVSKYTRKKRASFFCEHFIIDEHTKVLDLGSENGSNISAIFKGTQVKPQNIYIADIDASVVAEGSKAFGFCPVEIGESGPLPFPDSFFDIVYSSSVIEHVTVPKERVWCMRSDREFARHSRHKQLQFANEIRRIGKQYFVQTPYRYFPIESHSWLPFIGLLPRKFLIPTLRFTNLFWVKRTSPDWYLLNKRQMAELFEEATIFEEKLWGITKSLMAVYTSSGRSNRPLSEANGAS